MQNDNCQKEIEHDCKYDSMELLFCKQNPSKCVPLCNLFSEAYSIMGFLFYDFARIFIWLCGLLHDFIFLSLLLLNVVVTLCVCIALSLSLSLRAPVCVFCIYGVGCVVFARIPFYVVHIKSNQNTRVSISRSSFTHTYTRIIARLLFFIHNTQHSSNNTYIYTKKTEERTCFQMCFSCFLWYLQNSFHCEHSTLFDSFYVLF